MICTLKDVAIETGVSVTTVARVVHGEANVSKQTRARVLAAISKMQYSPNLNASELAQVRKAIRRKHSSKNLHAIRTNREGKEEDTIAEEIRSLQQENNRLRKVIWKVRSVLDDLDQDRAV